MKSNLQSSVRVRSESHPRRIFSLVCFRRVGLLKTHPPPMTSRVNRERAFFPFFFFIAGALSPSVRSSPDQTESGRVASGEEEEAPIDHQPRTQQVELVAALRLSSEQDQHSEFALNMPNIICCQTPQVRLFRRV